MPILHWYGHNLNMLLPFGPMYNITAMIDQLNWQKLGITLVYACFSAPNSCSYW